MSPGRERRIAAIGVAAVLLAAAGSAPALAAPSVNVQTGFAPAAPARRC